MLRYIVFGVTLTGLIIGTQLYLKHVPDAQQAEVPSASSTSVPDIQVTANKRQESLPAIVQQGLAANAQTDIEEEFTPTQVTRSEPIKVWQVDTDAPLPPSRFTNKGIDARPLKIAKEQFSQVGVGDMLELPIPQTSLSYNMSIKQIGRHRNGDKTLKGHLANQPRYAVIVTEGRSSTYATINTPDGSFMLEAKQEEGWILAANELDQLSDPNLTDYQIPEIDRNPN